MTSYLTFLFVVATLVFAHQRLVARPATQAQQKVSCFYPNWFADISGLTMVMSLGLLLVTQFYLERLRIPSPSMLPAFHVGQKVLATKLSFNVINPVTHLPVMRLGAPDIGQPIITRLPFAPDVKFIKRVWGRPGDTLSMDQTGITLNGVHYPFKMIRPVIYTYKDTTYDVELLHMEYQGVTYEFYNDPSQEFISVPKRTLQENEYFLIGDNLSHSTDSREFGTFHSDNFIASLL